MENNIKIILCLGRQKSVVSQYKSQKGKALQNIELAMAFLQSQGFSIRRRQLSSLLPQARVQTYPESPQGTGPQTDQSFISSEKVAWVKDVEKCLKVHPFAEWEAFQYINDRVMFLKKTRHFKSNFAFARSCFLNWINFCAASHS